MQHSKLGKTELSLPPVGICLPGTRKAWEESSVQAVLTEVADKERGQSAFDIGARLIDVCGSEGDALATVGSMLEHIPRDKYVLSLPVVGSRGVKPHTRDSIVQTIDQALSALMVNHLDIVYLQDVTREELQDGGAVDALVELKRTGKVRYIGLSAATETALFALANGSWDVLVIDNPSWYDINDSLVLPLAAHLGVGIITRSSFSHAGSVEEWVSAVRPMLDNPLVDVVLVNACSERHGVEVIHCLEEWQYPRVRVHQLESGDHRPRRCNWANDPLLQYYHDYEWGVLPSTDDRWFEFIVLETFQAGLSWKTILNKRLAFRKAFHQFDLDEVSRFSEDDVQRLMHDAGIVRNRKKIEAAVENARIAQRLREEYGSLANFMRHLGKSGDVLGGLQTTFRFVGRTTAESIAFATGLVSPPHDQQCWLHTS